MARNPAKKHRKEIERRRERASRERRAESLRRAAEKKGRYPEITFVGNADPGFETLIRSATAEIDFDDRGAFQPFERSTYRLIREHGAAYAAQSLDERARQLEEAGVPFGRIMSIYFSVNLGHQVFLRAGETLQKFLPVNDVRYFFRGNRIYAEFKTLKSHRLLGGTVYYSSLLPKIDVGGRLKIVAFSRHSIERICERLNPRWVTYAALGDVFAVFDRCVRFDYCDLHGGQPGFTFFDLCDDERFWQHHYVTKVLRKERLDPEAGTPYYRLGYCPAVVESIFFKAKSFLLPGYSSTPEAGLIRRSSLPDEEKRRMLRAAAEMSSEGLIEGSDLELVRWFHENGVAQVIQSRRPVFIEHSQSKPRRRRSFSTRLTMGEPSGGLS